MRLIDIQQAIQNYEQAKIAQGRSIKHCHYAIAVYDIEKFYRRRLARHQNDPQALLTPIEENRLLRLLYKSYIAPRTKDRAISIAYHTVIQVLWGQLTSTPYDEAPIILLRSVNKTMRHRLWAIIGAWQAVCRHYQQTQPSLLNTLNLLNQNRLLTDQNFNNVISHIAYVEPLASVLEIISSSIGLTQDILDRIIRNVHYTAQLAEALTALKQADRAVFEDPALTKIRDCIYYHGNGYNALEYIDFEIRFSSLWDRMHDSDPARKAISINRLKANGTPCIFGLLLEWDQQRYLTSDYFRQIIAHLEVFDETLIVALLELPDYAMTQTVFESIMHLLMDLDATAVNTRAAIFQYLGALPRARAEDETQLISPASRARNAVLTGLFRVHGLYAPTASQTQPAPSVNIAAGPVFSVV